MLRRLLPLAVLLSAPLAAAESEEREEVPASLEGVGRITLQGGGRVTSNETLYKSWYGREENAGLARAKDTSGGPIGVATFAYAVTDLVEVGIDLFGTGGRLRLNERFGEDGVTERRITTRGFGALLGLRFQTVLPEVGPYGLVPFVGLLTGPVLITSRREGEAEQEKSDQAWAGALGATWRLSARWALTAEYRLMFLRGPIGPEDARIGSFSLGGSWLSLGVTYTFPPVVDRSFNGGRL